MTGAAAVKLKFADVEGTFEDGLRMAAQMAQLGDDYKIFKPRKAKMSFFDLLDFDDDDDELNTLSEIKSYLAGAAKPSMDSSLKQLAQSFFKTKYLNQPLYMMPGYWE
jgi:protease IV